MSPTKLTDTQKKVLEQARSGQYREVEEAWLGLLSDPPADPEFYMSVMDAFDAAKMRKRAFELIVLAMEELQNRQMWRTMDIVLFKAASFWPTNGQLRDFMKKAMEGRYANQPELDVMLKRSRIDEDVPLDKSVRLFRRLLRVTPGNVYQHPSWGEGVVRSSSIAEGKIVLDFPGAPGKQMTVEGVRKFLTYLPPNHFLARRTRNPEVLQEMARENPVALVKLAVRTEGRSIKQSALKSLLTEGVIEPGSWNSWWTRARRALALDPFVDVEKTGGAHALIRLRSRPKTIEEEVGEIFNDADASVQDRVEAVKKLTEAARQDKVSEEFFETVLKRLEEDYRIAGEQSPAMQIEFAFLSEDLHALHPSNNRESPIPSPESILKEWSDYAVLLEIDHVDFQVRALQFMLERDGEKAVEPVAAIFPMASPKLAQAIWRVLDTEKHHELATRALEELLDASLENPSTYLWAMRSIIDGNWEELADTFPVSATVMRLLDDLKQWENLYSRPGAQGEVVASAKQLATRVRAMLSTKNYAAICTAAEALPLEQAQRLRRTIQTHPALSDSFKSQARRQMILTRRELDEALAEPPKAETDLCTQRARTEKIRELDELKTVKIPENTRAIKEAREEGDLRENAGYHAARDEQKILMQRALQLQESLSAVTVIDASMVSTEKVGFGARLEIENVENGERQTFTILGRWEADPDRDIFSIQAPFAEAFVGHRVGEEVEVEPPGGGKTTYRVLSIENALASGEWDTADAETQVGQPAG